MPVRDRGEGLFRKVLLSENKAEESRRLDERELRSLEIRLAGNRVGERGGAAELRFFGDKLDTGDAGMCSLRCSRRLPVLVLPISVEERGHDICGETRLHRIILLIR